MNETSSSVAGHDEGFLLWMLGADPGPAAKPHGVITFVRLTVFNLLRKLIDIGLPPPRQITYITPLVGSTSTFPRPGISMACTV